VPSDEYRRLASQLAGLQSPKSAYERFRRILGPEQLALCEDDSPQIAAHPGRRAGKTTSVLGKTLRAFAKRPGANVFYFAPTNEQGFGIVWEDLLKFNSKFKLGLEPRVTELAFASGQSRFEIFGFYNQKDVERARGRKCDLAIVDEAGLGPDWFSYFLSDVLAPTLLDYNGQLVLIGTPGPAASGPFFDACHALEGWSNQHHWTCAQNPFFAGRDPLAEARQRYHLTPESITYKREWLGQWIVDPDALVYYIPPPALRPWDGKAFSHVYGLDLGWNDADAISRISISPLRDVSHLTHMEATSQQTNHQLFARLRALQAEYPGPVVFDPAGHATRKTIETFAVDAPEIQWVMAEKARKVEFIQQLNDDLRSGKTFVDPQLAALMVKEATRLRWKKPGKLASDAAHSDPGDAWLYPWRYARDMLRELPGQAPPPVVKTPYELEMERMKREQQQGGIMRARVAKTRREAFS